MSKRTPHRLISLISNKCYRRQYIDQISKTVMYNSFRKLIRLQKSGHVKLKSFFWGRIHVKTMSRVSSILHNRTLVNREKKHVFGL